MDNPGLKLLPPTHSLKASPLGALVYDAPLGWCCRSLGLLLPIRHHLQRCVMSARGVFDGSDALYVHTFIMLSARYVFHTHSFHTLLCSFRHVLFSLQV